jgi:MFS family permease
MQQATINRLANTAVLRPLRDRDFRLLWLGQSVSLLGDQFHYVALPWLALQLTGSGLALGSVLSVAAIPRAIFMLIGGVLSDRMSPRRIMLLSNGIRAVLVAILAGLVGSGTIQLWHLYVLALSFGLIDAVFYPASLAVVPLLLEDQELEAGNSLVRGSQQLSVLVGPAPAGALVAAAGLAYVFGFDALTFVFATGMLWLMRGGSRVPRDAASDDGAARTVLGDLVDGIRYAWDDSVLRAILIFIAIVDFAATGAFGVGLPALADARFAGNATAFGIMLSAWGGGALLGTVLAGSVGQMRRRGRLVIGLGLGLGAGVMVVGVAPSLLVAAAVIAAMGVGNGFVNVAFVAWLQKRTDPLMLGRIMSLVMFASVGLAPVAYPLAGVLVDIDLTLTFIAAGGLVLLGGLFSAVNSDVRSID